jgi:hypothetical protein
MTFYLDVTYPRPFARRVSGDQAGVIAGLRRFAQEQMLPLVKLGTWCTPSTKYDPTFYPPPHRPPDTWVALPDYLVAEGFDGDVVEALFEGTLTLDRVLFEG